MFVNWKNKEKIDTLQWFDIVMLTLIFWGEAVKDSTVGYLELLHQTSTIEQMLDFGTADNYSILSKQLILFAIAILYLVIRKFNFKKLNIKFNIKAVLIGCLIFVGAGLTQDLWTFLSNPVAEYLPFPGMIGAFFENQTVSTVIYSLFNGMYEEIYFLGFCFAVKPKYLKYTIPFSILVRISFHTYQGMISAIGIGVVFGIYMLYVYHKSKDKNLLPFFIGHAWADILGLTFIGLLAGKM